MIVAKTRFLLEKLIFSPSYFLRFYYKIRDFKFRDEFFLVYTMGKVGSSSVYHSLKKRFPLVPVYHVHFLSKLYLSERLPKMHDHFKYNIPVGQSVLRDFEAGKRKKKRIIFTLVREPISREISNLFENYKIFTEKIEMCDVPKLEERLNGASFEFPQQWFNDEVTNYLKFDIFDFPFDQDRGYQIYEMDNFRMICIKLEKLNEIGEEVISNFLGCKKFRLHNYNVSSNKLGKQLFKNLSQNFTLSKESIDQIYSSRYMQHFYSKEEIEQFKLRWN